MGASYGGYAAMWAAARNPDMYRCAISFAGISDLETMMRYDRRQFAATRYYRSWRAKVQGDKEFDLDSVSPLYAIDRISIPMLIAHGTDDKIVPVAQSTKFHEALTKKNKTHTFVKYEGEGHGLDEPTNAVDFLKRVEGFLNTHNPAN
jgi:dipeptidyl aminopeptidase/acylaminoacyl peptidase